MRKKTFPLSGILKVRAYREQVAFQTFIKDTQEDRELAASFNILEQNIMHIPNTANTLDAIRYQNAYITHNRNLQREILHRRETLKEKTEQAKQKYQQVRIELESVKILYDKHIQEQRKIQRKYYYNEIQERILCEQ